MTLVHVEAERNTKIAVEKWNEDNMKQKILVLAYPGCGKTYLAENYKNVSDLEFQHYRYDYGKNKDLPLEKLKGIKERTLRPEWPENFFEFLSQQIEKMEIVLVPMATSLFPVLDSLAAQGTRIIFVIQDENMLEDIIEMYRKRGNGEEFIEKRRNDFQKFHNLTAESKFEKVYIHKGEHLYEALVRVGVKFLKGKGYKNYF